MADFSSTSAGDLRKMLVDSGKYTQEQADAIKGKTKLVEAVLQLNGDIETDEGDIFSSLLKDMQQPLNILDTINAPTPKNDSVPDYNSPEWPDYVMQQFTESEKDGEYPTLVGLRRVAELLLGSIIQSGPTHIVAPTNEDSPGRATCVCTVVFDWGETGQERAFSAVGGAYPGNTDEIYAIFPEAIAEARAEGRALRKALKLKVMTAEEAPKVKKPHIEQVSTGEWCETDSITELQKVFTIQKCKEMNISIEKLLAKDYGGRELDTLNKGEGKSLIELLSSYQTNTKTSKDIPEEIKIV